MLRSTSILRITFITEEEYKLDLAIVREPGLGEEGSDVELPCPQDTWNSIPEVYIRVYMKFIDELRH